MAFKKQIAGLNVILLICLALINIQQNLQLNFQGLNIDDKYNHQPKKPCVDFVTLTFNHQMEINLLKLQAKSFRFVNKHMINNIFIVYNDDGWYNFTSLIENSYPSHLRSKVKIIYRDHIIDLHGSNWFNQQLIKLLISKYIQSRYYIILDGKNHFIRNINYNDFVPNSKPIMFLNDPGGPMLDVLYNSLDYFNIDYNKQQIKYYYYYNQNISVSNHTEDRPITFNTITPFVMVTEFVQEMIHVCARNDSDFVEFFLQQTNDMVSTEFYLYTAYLLYSKKIEKYSLRRGLNCLTVWPDLSADWNQFENKKLVLTDGRYKMFGLHRRALAAMSLEYKTKLLWLYQHFYANNTIQFIHKTVLKIAAVNSNINILNELCLDFMNHLSLNEQYAFLLENIICNENIEIESLETEKTITYAIYACDITKWETEYLQHSRQNEILLPTLFNKPNVMKRNILFSYCYLGNNIEIPNNTFVVSSENIQNKNQLIEKNIFQTMPIKIDKYTNNVKLLKQLNPEYTYYFYTNNDIDNFMNNEMINYFNGNVTKAYNLINNNIGSAKADIWRYSILYIKGGIYLDYDCVVLESFRNIIDTNDTAIISNEGANNLHLKEIINLYKSNDINKLNEYKNNEIIQYAMMFQSKHVILENVLTEISNQILSKKFQDKYLNQPIVNSRSMYEIVYNTVGPIAFTNGINYAINNSNVGYRFYFIQFNGNIIHYWEHKEFYKELSNYTHYTGQVNQSFLSS